MSENRIPDPFTVPLILIPWLVIPDPGAVIPDPTPFFLLLIPDPIYLVTTLSIYKMRLTEEKRYKNFHLRLFLAEMTLNVLVMCNRTEEERRRQTLCDKFCLKKTFRQASVSVKQIIFLKDQKTLMLSSRQTRN